MTKKSWFFALFLCLTACGKSIPVDGNRLNEASRFLMKDQYPQFPAIKAAWFADANVGELACGEIDAPIMLRDTQPTLRFYYDYHGHYGQVEFHRLWRGNAIGEALVAQNRAIFEEMWTRSCAPFAPLGRKISWKLRDFGLN